MAWVLILAAVLVGTLFAFLTRIDLGGVPTPTRVEPERTPGTGTSVRAPGPLRADAGASWRRLSQPLPARVGLSVIPLGHGPTRSFGQLRSGHAWSAIKVPIVVTLLDEVSSLKMEEKALARAALTASDNDAAAALFARIEASRGGLAGASEAVEATLRAAGDRTTAVTTAPPPTGAVSTYGQTDWSLTNSAQFFRSLARGCLLDRGKTGYVLGLMEEVVPEQRWGLGEAGFDPTWGVAFKGGWGPDSYASGPYLVRQAGVLRDGDTAVAVAVAAQADTGAFQAGVEAIDRIAAWLAGSLRDFAPGPRSRGGCHRG